MSEMEYVKNKVSWKHIIITALATGVSAILAMYAVVVAPVAPFPGVSGLYLAAAIYVPLSLWLGVWGCIAGYLSCVILGLCMTPFGVWSFVWALADFFEGFIPLAAFRLTKSNVDLAEELKKPKITKILIAILIINLIIAAFATALSMSELWITTLIISIGLIVVLYIINRSKSWLIYVVFGIIGASMGSAVFGVWVPILGGFAPAESFWTGFIGWFAGDLIVLSSISTTLMLILTSYIKRTSFFVKNWFV
ncbi:MAG: hypothetical protein ACTSPY_09085 [Candidatus Helarchaeota archaeon]